MKYFFITIDTEGDNLWNWKNGNKITTENSKYIPRFQSLCEEYGFKPVYLTNYEMAMDQNWVDYASNKSMEGKCEIGIHLHAWNSPPDYCLSNVFGGNPYITEYPYEVIAEKVDYLLRILENNFQTQIISHRSGRWATNQDYFEILSKAGIRIDCSVTPGLDLSHIKGCSSCCGSNYSSFSTVVNEIYPGIIEIPMTTRKIKGLYRGSIKHKIKTLVRGEDFWLRPHKKDLNYLLKLTDYVERENIDCLEFMLHSSELMPGGSPYFKDSSEIELLYNILNSYFKIITDKGYIGTTFKEYERFYHEHN